MRRHWPLGLYRVAGDSMRPAYAPGDLLLGWRWFRPRAGQVVVIHRERPLVKRIKRVQAEAVWIEGDNAAASTDSRAFGPVPRAQLEAVIVARLSRA
jgi:nickel-type superoxide dismutase maturation protease